MLNAGLRIARREGYLKVTRQQIADALGMQSGTLHHHFGTMTRFRRALVRHAILKSDVKVLAQALIAGDTNAKKAPHELRIAAAQFIAGDA